MDKRGRIMIPSRIRRDLQLSKKTKCILALEKNGITISPIEEQNASLKIRMKDAPGSLAKSAGAIAKRGVNIVMSQSRTLRAGEVSEWDVVVNAPRSILRVLENDISRLKTVEEVSVEM